MLGGTENLKGTSTHNQMVSIKQHTQPVGRTSAEYSRCRCFIKPRLAYRYSPAVAKTQSHPPSDPRMAQQGDESLLGLQDELDNLDVAVIRERSITPAN